MVERLPVVISQYSIHSSAMLVAFCRRRWDGRRLGAVVAEGIGVHQIGDDYVLGRPTEELGVEPAETTSPGPERS